MADSVHRIPLPEPFTAPERGRYQAVLGDDDTWRIQTAGNEWDGFPLEPGDTITAVHVETSRFEIQHAAEPDGNLILDLPVRQNDAGAATVREYLIALLRVAMDIKAPWGNSGWVYDLYEALASAGFLAAQFDSDGLVDDWGAVDKVAGDRLIQAAIDALGRRDG